LAFLLLCRNIKFMNKNVLVGFNIVLLILVGILFYLHFSSTPKKTETPAVKVGSTNTNTVSAPFKIAYFEMDSIENNYEYLKDVKSHATGPDTGTESYSK
jgi:outer membrane protein